MKKHICLLATGGTIVCEEGADGLRPVLTGAELLRAVPELARCGEIDVIELFSLDSSNLLPMHWQRMAPAIAERCGQYDGFVLTHGTDTMGYTAGALYYMLRGIGVPVALKYLDGMDSLLSIVQMPAGVPVATVAIGNARNAGLLAVRILAAADDSLLERMLDFQESLRDAAHAKGQIVRDAAAR